MIEAIKEIGDFVKIKEGKGVKIFCDVAKLERKTKNIICILLEKDNNGKYSYKEVFSEKYSEDKPILYRGLAGSGPDLLPSTLITDVEKAFKKRIIGWFKKREEDEFKEIYHILKKYEDKIERKLVEEFENLPKDKRNNVLLTIKIKENGKEKHLGETDVFRDILRQDVIKRYYFLESIGESKGEGTCYLCEHKRKVYGFVFPALGFSFATADKRGFTPSFIQTDAWKNIPICEECAISLEIGKKFLDKYLNFPKKNENNFFGCKYYVIPRFVFGSMFDKFYKWINWHKNKNYEEGLLSKEDWIEKEVGEKGDILRLIFMFYSQKGGGKYIDIVQYVEDVLPSWIKKIHDAQEEVKKDSLFKEDNLKKILGKDWVGNFVNGRIGKDKGLGRNNWYAVFTRTFFPYSKTHGIYDKYFIDIISALLSNKRIDKDFIISAFVREIRNAVKDKNGHDIKILCLKSFMLYLFFRKLNILGDNMLWVGEKMEEKKEGSVEENITDKVEKFFEKYGFDKPAKKAAFSVGMLVDYLLWVQRTERRSEFGQEPFWSKLHGLVLDERKIKNIFREAIAKLRQYRKTFPSLEKTAGKYLAEAEGKWKLSREEISYYFALGMTLRNIFSFEKNEKSNGGE